MVWTGHRMDPNGKRLGLPLRDLLWHCAFTRSCIGQMTSKCCVCEFDVWFFFRYFEKYGKYGKQINAHMLYRHTDDILPYIAIGIINDFTGGMELKTRGMACHGVDTGSQYEEWEGRYTRTKHPPKCKLQMYQSDYTDKELELIR